jgi:hypothetical protein
MINKFICFILILTTCVNATQFPDSISGKKIVSTHNRVLDDTELPLIWKDILNTPLDGFAITLKIPDAEAIAKTDTPTSKFFQAVPWNRDWFTSGIKVIKELPRSRPVELFWKLNTNPGNVDWFDDQAWQVIVNNGRMAAAGAKEAGMKGFVFDAEPYDEKYRPFEYARQPQRERHSYTEYAAKARQRGRELMKAWATEFPDMTVLTYFMHSYAAQWSRWQNPCAAGVGATVKESTLSQHAYGLYIPFLEGWLDELPPSMKLVDGAEEGYYPRTREEYLELAHVVHRRALELVTPANHSRYKSQVSAGFGFFLDGSLVLPDDQQFSIPPPAGMSKVDWFRLRLSWALDSTDEYVWIYGEAGRWWPDAKLPLWEKLTPGITATLNEARDLKKYQLSQIESQLTQMPNLLKNSAFTGDPSKEWGQYTADYHTGQVRYEPGYAIMTRCGNSSLWQTFPAEPGQRYYLSAKAKWKGSGGPRLILSWRDQNKSISHLPYVNCLPDGLPDADGWYQLHGYATVPAGTSAISFSLSVNGQGLPTDTVEWKEPRLSVIKN